MITNVVEAKRSPTVFLSLTGKARETILKMDLDDLNNKEGMMKLYAKFDKLFKVDVSSEFMSISLKNTRGDQRSTCLTSKLNLIGEYNNLKCTRYGFLILY